MFRVPSNPDNPTFDDTFKVGRMQWLKSSKSERDEWKRRRNLAAKLAQEGQAARMHAWVERKNAEQLQASADERAERHLRQVVHAEREAPKFDQAVEDALNYDPARDE
jgi:hypothetical protein